MNRHIGGKYAFRSFKGKLKVRSKKLDEAKWGINYYNLIKFYIKQISIKINNFI